jgi:hypothetical protein
MICEKCRKETIESNECWLWFKAVLQAGMEVAAESVSTDDRYEANMFFIGWGKELKDQLPRTDETALWIYKFETTLEWLLMD